jgi:hypothetical protein
LAWKSGLKVSLLPLESSCPLQTILLSDLVMRQAATDSMANRHAFFNFKGRQTAIFVSSGLPHPTQQVQILKYVRLTAITICYGLSHPDKFIAI